MRKTAIFTLILLSCLNSCYRMPTDNDYCVIPNLNNPDITREKSSANPLGPNLGF